MTRKAKSSDPSQRMLRVGELIRHALAQFLARGDVQDPDLFDVAITVPEVRMSPDLKLASAYVVPLGGQDVDRIVAALNRHKKFIRGRIVPALDLKYAPEIRFFADTTFDEFGRIDSLLRSDKVQRDLDHEDDDD